MFLRKHRKKLFAAYCVWMLVLLFGRRGGISGLDYWQQVQMNCNFIPLHTLKQYLHLLTLPRLRLHALINLAGNVVMFAPMGFFLPLVFEKLRKFHKTILIAVLIICFVEVLQLVTLLGSCDVDDLLLNLIGTALGYGIFRKLGKDVL